MDLIYTFNEKLSNDKIYQIVNIYNESYKNNIRFHDIILYTDKNSEHFFENTFNNIKIFDSEFLTFTDDYKYQILPLLSDNQILFDGDIFLTHPLLLPENYDILCDSIVGNILDDDYYLYYKNTVSILLENSIKDVIGFFTDEIKFVPNVGILKFKNSELEKKFLDYYWIIKNWYIKNNLEKKYNIIKNDYRSCAVFGQYFLSLFIKEYNLNVVYASDNNLYYHLSGDSKYNISLKKSLL